MKSAFIAAAVTVGVGLAIMPLFPERTAANIIVPVIAGLAWLFALLYGFRSQWTATVAGRAVLYLAFALAAFSTQLSVSIWVGWDYWARNQLRFVLYFGLAVTIGHLIWTVVRAQRSDREEGGV